jgi:hypothetical protein
MNPPLEAKGRLDHTADRSSLAERPGTVNRAEGREFFVPAPGSLACFGSR